MRAAKLSPRDARRMRDFLSRFVDGTEGYKSEEAEYLLGTLLRNERRRPAKVIALPGKTKAERKAEKNGADRLVYAYVAKRDTECQCGDHATFGPCDGPLHIDHQWGRGKAPTTERNCRRLCTKHDQMKTENKPSRKAWLVNYAVWAFGKRFFEEYDKAKLAIAMEEAQHPARRNTQP